MAKQATRAQDAHITAIPSKEKYMMDPMQLMELAQTRAALVIGKVEPAQLAAPTPCAGWTVRTCLNKLVTSTKFWAVALVEGRRDPVLDLISPPDIVGHDPLVAYTDAAEACRKAFTAAGVFERVVPCPIPGLDLTGDQMLGLRIFDTTVITWDVARATDVPHGIDDEQAAFALAVAEVVIPVAANATDHHRFRPAASRPGGSPLERLIALTGRDPDWMP
jgi:uncharacterized protein (TIGR03086 family)